MYCMLLHVIDPKSAQKVIFWYTSTKEWEEHNILVWIDQNSIE